MTLLGLWLKTLQNFNQHYQCSKGIVTISLDCSTWTSLIFCFGDLCWADVIRLIVNILRNYFDCCQFDNFEVLINSQIHWLLQSLFTFSFTSFEPAFLFVLHSSFSQSNLHIGFNLRAFVICTNFLPSFLFTSLTSVWFFSFSVLTQLMNASNSIYWIILFYILDFWIIRYLLCVFLDDDHHYFCWLQLFETASHRIAAHFTLISLLSKYNFKRGGCGVWCAFRTNNLCRIRRSPALR